MKYSLLEVAFAGLLHDIGKFYQRTKMKSDLTEDEEKVTPKSKNADFHTHLHSGYTARFFHEYLQMMTEYEMLTSAHHIDSNDKFGNIIKDADRIASAIDRNDEKYDMNERNNSGVFQQVRLSSVLGTVDFGKEKSIGIYDLLPFSEMKYPHSDYEAKNKAEAVNEYAKLFDKFRKDIMNDLRFTGNIDKYSYDRLYALLNEYTVSIPASTYEGNRTFVSLFDHLKLTSAIASCLYLNESEEKKFYMLEFDISGIQRFIFKITEGKDTKRDIAKALRGRSLFISLITDFITYSYLNEFGLTQSNIMFNTGGGALLLLPNCPNVEDRIKQVSQDVMQALYKMFNTDITYVYAYVLCDSKELEEFKTDKAIELKEKLDHEKSRKFSTMIDEQFFYTKSNKSNICKMCGSNYVDNEKELCASCKIINEISQFFVKHHEMYIVFDFHKRMENLNLNSASFTIGSADIYFIDEHDYDKVIGNYDFIQSLNHTQLGYTRLIANSAPMYGNKENQLISFEDISDKLIADSYGDKKLGILKMDVDNLGAIFAFGLSGSRSLSKFLTLSRLTEMFFSINLMQICKDISKKMNPDIDKKTGNGTMFYINYAGGDDLVIVGPIAGILELANEIHMKFNEFTLNKNMTISGGIHIQSPKEPIRFGIQAAEENLHKSKMMSEKNHITLLDTSCKMTEFGQVLGKVKYFKSLIDEEIISRTSFYNYMLLADKKSIESFYQSVPKLLYSFKRNVNNEEVRIELIKIISAIKDIDKLRVLILEMKLAIMQTREV